MRAKSGFTLVEILIVVVILGILAAIVIPQFTDASTEAKTSALVSDLQTMRSQIELYKIQHNDALPSAATVGFVPAMTGKTDQYGAAGGDLGPYIMKVPTNPFCATADANDVEIEAGITGLGGGDYGWHFDTGSGMFRADTDAHTSL
ncbi:MAG: type II secretion system protein [Planctomycetota bacterium]|jgi:general secretion pathway protein G